MAVNTAHAKVACQINDLASVRVGGSLIKGTPKEALYFKGQLHVQRDFSSLGAHLFPGFSDDYLHLVGGCLFHQVHELCFEEYQAQPILQSLGVRVFLDRKSVV